MWIVLALFFPELIGCWDKKELEEQGFVSIIGLDPSKNGLHQYTFSIINPLASNSPSSSGKGSSNVPTSKVITVEANGLVPAISIANSLTSKNITVSHAHIFLISSHLARQQDLRYLLIEMARYREFREDIMVYVVSGSASEFIETFKPTLEVYNYKYFDLAMRSAESSSSLFPVINLKEVLTRMSSVAEETVIPMTMISPHKLPRVTHQQNGTFSSESNYEVDSLPKRSDSKEVIIGAAVFRKGKMVGQLSGKDVRIFRILQGNWKQFSFSMPDPKKPRFPIMITFKKKTNPEIKVISTYPPKVEIHVQITGTITGITSGIDYVTNDALRNELTRATNQYITIMANDLIKKSQVKFNSDILGVGQKMRHKFWTWQSWQDYKWSSRYQEATIRAKLNVDYQFSGYTLRPYEGITQDDMKGGTKQ